MQVDKQGSSMKLGKEWGLQKLQQPALVTISGLWDFSPSTMGSGGARNVQSNPHGTVREQIELFWASCCTSVMKENLKEVDNDTQSDARDAELTMKRNTKNLFRILVFVNTGRGWGGTAS